MGISDFLLKKREIPLALWFVLILFFIKCTILAFSIIPLWNIPDEMGHFSYIQDIAMGRGLPVLGETPIAQNVWGGSQPQMNYIAQHPPLYHILGAIFLKIGNIFIHNSYWLFHFPRILSVLFATGTLLVIFIFLKEFSGDEFFALVCSAAVSFIPMYSFMASGTNHDMAVVFFSCLSFLFLYRFLSNQCEKNAYLSALSIGAACTVKFSAFLLAAPIVIFLFILFKGNWIQKTMKTVFVFLLTGIPPALYLIRNWIILGNPFVIDLYYKHSVVTHVGFIEYLQITPVADHVFRNFFALMNMRGKWLQIDELFFSTLCLLFLVIILLALYWYLNERIYEGKISDYIIILIFFILFTAMYLGIFSEQDYSISQKILYSLILSIPCFCLAFVREYDERKKFQYMSLATILFYLIVFTSVFFIPAFERNGVIRATQGRYFFPLIPLLVICYIYPAYKLIKPPRWILFVLVILSAMFEFSFFIMELIPFFEGVIL